MEIYYTNQNGIEERIKQELERCRVPEEKISEVRSKIVEYINFIFQKRNSKIPVNSKLWDFYGKLNAVVETFSNYGLSYNSYLNAAIKQKQLFYLSPKTIERKIRDLVKRFEKYGLKVDDYLKAALKQPSLFYQSSETIEGKIRDLAKRFEKEGLTIKDYLKAALKQPSLFYQSPETIERKIRDLAKRFEKEGLTVDNYLKAALKQPPLFCRSSDAIERNIIDLVERFKEEGLTVENYLKAALKKPSLFCQSSKTISQHIRLAQFLVQANVIAIQNDLLQWLIKKPSYLALGKDNFKLRFYYAKLLNKPTTLKNLTKPRKAIEAELEKEFGTFDIEKLREIYKNKIFKILI